jgi:hypothetical protein
MMNGDEAHASSLLYLGEHRNVAVCPKIPIVLFVNRAHPKGTHIAA